MIPLKDKPNVVAPGGDYPYGRIKDAAGGNPGTLVNTMVYGDIHQFFEKLMDAAGIVPNGLSDNSTNGFQLFEALNELIANDAWVDVSAAPTITSNSGMVGLYNHSSFKSRYKVRGKTFVWEFSCNISISGTAPTSITFSMPLPAGVTPLPLFQAMYNSRNFLASNMATQHLVASVAGSNVVLRKLDGTAITGTTHYPWFRVEFEIL